VRHANEQVPDAMQQWRYTIEDLVAAADTVACRYPVTFLHSEDCPGIPATGKEVVEHGIMLVRVAGGCIVEMWDQADRLGLLQQLGMLPALGTATTPSLNNSRSRGGPT